jgi:hypothetical protein
MSEIRQSTAAVVVEERKPISRGRPEQVSASSILLGPCEARETGAA